MTNYLSKVGWDCTKHVKVGRGRCWACADERIVELERLVEQHQSDEWYAEQVRRQNQQAPA